MSMMNFFDKPKALPTLSATEALNDTSSQTGQLPGLAALTQQSNQYTNDQFRSAIGQLLPGYQGALDSSMGSASSFLKGNIPQDVQDFLSRSDAFKSLSGGFGSGSGMGRDLAARDLGLTSLDMVSRGQQMLGQDLSFANMLTPGRMSPGQFLMNPMQMLQLQAQNNPINYANATSVSPFDSFLTSNVMGGMGMGTSMMGGMMGGATGPSSGGGGGSNPFNSFNPMLAGSGGVAGGASGAGGSGGGMSDMMGMLMKMAPLAAMAV